MNYRVTVSRTQTITFEVEAPDKVEAEFRAYIMTTHADEAGWGLPNYHTAVRPIFNETLPTQTQNTAPLDTGEYLGNVRREGQQILVNEKTNLEAKAQERDKTYLDELDRMLDMAKIRLTPSIEEEGGGAS